MQDFVTRSLLAMMYVLIIYSSSHFPSFPILPKHLAFIPYPQARTIPHQPRLDPIRQFHSSTQQLPIRTNILPTAYRLIATALKQRQTTRVADHTGARAQVKRDVHARGYGAPVREGASVAGAGDGDAFCVAGPLVAAQGVREFKEQVVVRPVLVVGQHVEGLAVRVGGGCCGEFGYGGGCSS
jgi:hypothetical protein